MGKSVGQLLAKAKIHEKNGETGTAREIYIGILERFPNNQRAKQSLAVLGLPKSDQKDMSRAQINELMNMFKQGRLEELVSLTKQLIVRYPKDANLHNFRGLAFAKMRRPNSAIQSFQKALKVNRKFAEAHNNLANVHFAEGELDAAIDGFRNSIQLAPKYAEAHFNLGNALQQQGQSVQAVECFNKAIDIKPTYLEAYLNLCSHLEKSNDIDGFESALTKAVNYCGQGNPLIRFFLALLSSRKFDYNSAVEHLEIIKNERLPLKFRRPYFTLLGKSLDKIGRFDDAYAAFEIRNQLSSAELAGRTVSAENYLKSVVSTSQDWAASGEVQWSCPIRQVEEKQLVFLIGFPRSGTTLLDTILRSHPDIKVFEEKPLVHAMQNEVGHVLSFQDLHELSNTKIERLRDVYFKSMEEFEDDTGDSRDKRVIVDKHPLNIRQVGLIQRVFPKAKFLLAIRHPCDCVLSCFMQDFELNEAMANFLSLESTAILYSNIFEMWSVYQRKLSLDVYCLKYEELVKDMEGTCKPLIKFLGLNWDDNLNNYQQTALDRGKIHTPSYHQVVQPLYGHASGRWRNYERELQPMIPVLQPWIEHFEYN